MSKRLKNYPDPHVVIQHFGADAIRLYMLNSPAVKADDLGFAREWCRAGSSPGSDPPMECLQLLRDLCPYLRVEAQRPFGKPSG